MTRAPGTYAILETSQGSIVCRLFEKEAPQTVANFVGLAEGTKEFSDPRSGQKAKNPFFDGLAFHRVIPDFMIQGGCPLGTGTGGPGYKFGDEFHASLRHDRASASSVTRASDTRQQAGASTASGTSGSAVHDGPIFVFTMPIPMFTMVRSGCSRWYDLRVHDGPILAFTMGRNAHAWLARPAFLAPRRRQRGASTPRPANELLGLRRMQLLHFREIGVQTT